MTIFLSCGHEVTDDMRDDWEAGRFAFTTKDYSYYFVGDESVTAHATSHGEYCLACQAKWPPEDVIHNALEEQAWFASSPHLKSTARGPVYSKGLMIANTMAILWNSGGTIGQDRHHRATDGAYSALSR